MFRHSPGISDALHLHNPLVVPLTPNQQAEIWVKSAIKVEGDLAELQEQKESTLRMSSATSEKLKIHLREFQMLKEELEKVNVEAGSLTGLPECTVDSVRVQAKRDALFPLYEAAASNYAKTQLSYNELLDKLPCIKILRKPVKKILAERTKSILKHTRVHGSISPEGLMFLIRRGVKDLEVQFVSPTLHRQFVELALQSGIDVVTVPEFVDE